MAEVNFTETVKSLLGGMEGFISTKTVIGEAIQLEDGTVILPLVDVSFGVGAGAFSKDTKSKAGGGMGGKMTASAILVIKDGNTRMISVKDQDTLSRMFEMVPDVLARLKKMFDKKDENVNEVEVPEEEINAIADELLQEEAVPDKKAKKNKK